MVVRALQGLGVEGARVNERHDIVQDVGREGGTFKVSGSAYKLTRLRSLHHGTCLLESPNLGRISPLLRSPAEGYIKSRGVESVRSPVRNVGVGYGEFVRGVVEEFEGMYGEVQGGSVAVGDDALEVGDVRNGFEELKVRRHELKTKCLLGFRELTIERSRPSGHTAKHRSSPSRPCPLRPIRGLVPNCLVIFRRT